MSINTDFPSVLSNVDAVVNAAADDDVEVEVVGEEGTTHMISAAACCWSNRFWCETVSDPSLDIRTILGTAVSVPKFFSLKSEWREVREVLTMTVNPTIIIESFKVKRSSDIRINECYQPNVL